MAALQLVSQPDVAKTKRKCAISTLIFRKFSGAMFCLVVDIAELDHAGIKTVVIDLITFSLLPGSIIRLSSVNS